MTARFFLSFFFPFFFVMSHRRIIMVFIETFRQALFFSQKNIFIQLLANFRKRMRETLGEREIKKNKKRRRKWGWPCQLAIELESLSPLIKAASGFFYFIFFSVWSGSRSAPASSARPLFIFTFFLNIYFLNIYTNKEKPEFIYRDWGIFQVSDWETRNGRRKLRTSRTE